MSFNIERSSALEVTLLELHVSGLGSFELSSVSIHMQVNGECIASCVPVAGKDTIKGESAQVNLLSSITPDMRCRIYMRLGNNGNMGDNKSLLFEGRLAANTLEVLSNPYNSTASVQIQLRHIAYADLGGVEIATRTYYVFADDTNAFDVSEWGKWCTTTRYNTQEWDEGRFAVYIKKLVTALFNWYTGGGTNNIQINEILKAVPCVLNWEAAGLPSTDGGIQLELQDLVERTFQGAMGSKASLLSFMSSLCHYCLFNIIPTSNAIVITPKLNVTRFTDQDIYLNKKKLISVIIPYQALRMPVEKVCLNHEVGYRYTPQDGENGNYNYMDGNMGWIDHFRWPPIDGGGALLVDVPPILSKIYDSSAQSGDSLNIPVALNKGGKASTVVNSAGLKPYMVPMDLDRRVGTIAARLVWSQLAFSNRSIIVNIIPHWIFSPDFHSKVGQVYEEGTPWGLLGKTVKVKAPYSLAESEDSEDIPYIGYVNSMDLSASVEGAGLSVTATITNVRTTVEDQWAFAPTDNPLYDNIDAQPV